MNGDTQAKSQAPAIQLGAALGGAVHTVVQSPQCAVLLVRSTQEPSQFSVPPPQVTPHLPPVHTALAPQLVVQFPQWALSEVKSTQAPPHLL